jgi:hypothetical protein
MALLSKQYKYNPYPGDCPLSPNIHLFQFVHEKSVKNTKKRTAGNPQGFPA